MDLKATEQELKKRLNFPYNWNGIKQNNVFDKKTDFIYSISDFDRLLEQINCFKDSEQFELLRNYSLNRWYNFQSAKAVEYMFCQLAGVKPALNSKDKMVDFEINGIRLDLKTSVFPAGFNKNINDAKQTPRELIEWLYDNQSSEKRQHYGNRLFIVLFDSNNKKHWKLKAELIWLQSVIEKYMNGFDAGNLHYIKFKNNKEAWSDIIWAVS